MSSPSHAQQLRRLRSVTDPALAHLELDELLTELLRRTVDLLGVDTCAVLLLDESRGELVARAAHGIEEEVEQGVGIPLGQGFAGRVAGERRPIVLDDVDHADVLNPILHEKGIQSLLGVPLLVEAAAIGVLHVGTLTPHEFTQDDIELLQLVADRIAIALEHARAVESERKGRMRLERVQSVTDVALAHLELEHLLSELLQRIVARLGVDTCAILLLDEERDELVARAALGIEEEVEQGVRIPLGRGFAGRVAAHRRPIFLPDVDTADIYNPILREKGIKSLLGVPLLVEAGPIGVLHVGSLTHREFTQDDVELLQLVADRVALAIERARVHDETVRLDQLKLNFVAIASHELRTPASAVYGALATLRSRGDELSADIREQLEETAWEQSDRLRRLIEQLLDLSRLDARSTNIEPRPVVLASLLDNLAKVVNGDDIVVDVDPSLAVVADPLVIDRVVTNLLANAKTYGEPPIVLTAEARDRHVRIAVTDRGPGVPEELVPRLFERFERGQRGHGTGLGLAIARAYANAHGGELLYEPRPDGARFELVLPRT